MADPEGKKLPINSTEDIANVPDPDEDDLDDLDGRQVGNFSCELCTN